MSKIIQGDWDWQYNRSDTLQMHDWHNNTGDRKQVMLWGDSHVSFFQFPSNAFVSDDAAPDPNYIFW
ncbi:MAG TPA: hypothetical protein VGR14_03470 [Verrucomicrobiae bacterium]|nr:hypothetical protein [Verrucomicrobiae bacterium]